MQSNQIPTKFGLAFGANAQSPTYIHQVPTPSQIQITPGAASMNDGFPPVCFLPVGGGGVPPFGNDFNGILNQLSLWAQWQSAGGPVAYDPTFQTAIGGYPKGCTIASAVTSGLNWTSTVENNTTNPDAGGAGWLSTQVSGIVTGTLVPYAGSTAPSGYLFCNGSAVSRSTFSTLFGIIGTTFGAGDGVTTFNLPDMRGRLAAGLDSMGSSPLAGRLTSLSITGGGGAAAIGGFGGSESITLTVAQLASHNHGVNDPTHSHVLSDPGHIHALTDPGHSHGVNDPGHIHSITNFPTLTGAASGWFSPSSGNTEPATGETNAAATGISIQNAATGASIHSATTGASVAANSTGVTTQNQGSGAATVVVQPTMVLNWLIKT